MRAVFLFVGNFDLEKSVDLDDVWPKSYQMAHMRFFTVYDSE